MTETLEVGGLTVHVEGKGPRTIVMVHGQTHKRCRIRKLPQCASTTAAFELPRQTLTRDIRGGLPARRGGGPTAGSVECRVPAAPGGFATA